MYWGALCCFSIVVMLSSIRSATARESFCPNSTSSNGVILLFSQNRLSFRSLTSAVTILLLARLSYQRRMSLFDRRLSFFVIWYCFAVVVWFCSYVNFFPTSDRTALRSSSVRKRGFVVFTLFMIESFDLATAMI